VAFAAPRRLQQRELAEVQRLLRGRRTLPDDLAASPELRDVGLVLVDDDLAARRLRLVQRDFVIPAGTPTCASTSTTTCARDASVVVRTCVTAGWSRSWSMPAATARPLLRVRYVRTTRRSSTTSMSGTSDPWASGRLCRGSTATASSAGAALGVTSSDASITRAGASSAVTSYRRHARWRRARDTTRSDRTRNRRPSRSR
jgi:hypothetical protein